MAKKKAKKAKAKSASAKRRSVCPIACTLDLVGDKWTLLVVRDLMAGARTYGDLAASPESIPTNLLADRLKRLVGAGLAKKSTYQTNPPRYEYQLTESGWGLQRVLDAVKDWGLKSIPGSEARIAYGKQGHQA